jgi:hypothetical protein
MPNPALDIATALQTAGLGTLGTNLYVSTVLDDDAGGTIVPDAAVFVAQTSGAQPQPFLGGSDAEDIYYVNVQIRTRSARNSYEVALAQLVSIHEALHKQQTSDYIYWLVDPPIQLGPDDKTRHEWSVNVAVLYQD